MINLNKVKAYAFDFGGTLDSPFLHWMDIYLKLYNEQLHLPLTKENFRDAYVYAERMMEKESYVNPSHSLLETQLFKTHLQFAYLADNNIIELPTADIEKIALKAAKLVTDYSSAYVAKAKPVLEILVKKYDLLLVSNYYGNVAKVVSDMGIAGLFKSITDSTIENVRKPDPRLWKIAIERQGYLPEEVVIVGDSMKNDILPALALGCQAVQGIPESGKIPENCTSITSLDELLLL